MRKVMQTSFPNWPCFPKPVFPSIPLHSEKNVWVAQLWTHKAKADVDTGLKPLNTD